VPFSINDILLGILLPAAVSLGTIAGLFGFGFGEAVRRAALPIALVAGFAVGYGALSLGPLVPQSHWQWIPASIGLAALIDVLAPSARESRLFRAAIFVLFAAGCGDLLVPAWDDLNPSRSVHLVVWPLITAAVALSAGWGAGASREPDAPRLGLVLSIALAFLAAAILLALAGSLRFSQFALAMFGALAGVLTATRFQRNRIGPDAAAMTIAVSLCGFLLVGRVNSFSAVPLISYLLIPLAVIAAGLAGDSPVGARLGRRSEWVGLGLAVTICGCALGLAAWAES
jgi:hypothetical protein